MNGPSYQTLVQSLRFRDVGLGDSFRFHTMGDDLPSLVKRTKRSYYCPRSGRCFTTGAGTAVILVCRNWRPSR